ncbi:MAG TPA: hypothetical protein VG188_02120 [Solirubrobacteraceae bacterium]|jgi:hypothetical protein|nr:hypothetical protein [Solirubrobacteraceae bacterium]
MLLILIPIAWLAVLSLIVAVCRVAAEGDARPTGLRGSREELIGIKLTLSHAGHSRLHGRRTLARPGMAGGRQRIAAHSLRPR